VPLCPPEGADMNRRAAPVAQPRTRVAAVAGLVVVAGLAVASPAAGVTSAAARLPAAVTPAATGSPVTVLGTGEFADLKVTVDQTQGLINQVVTITWTGGQPTVPTGSRFGIEYLQIMQCWGDDDSAPVREQCQFGGLLGDGRGGANAA